MPSALGKINKKNIDTFWLIKASYQELCVCMYVCMKSTLTDGRITDMVYESRLSV